MSGFAENVKRAVVPGQVVVLEAGEVLPLAPAQRTPSVGAIRTTALTTPGMAAARVLTFYDEQMRPIAHAELTAAMLEAFALDALAVSAAAEHGAPRSSPSVLSVLAPERVEMPRS